MESVGEFRLKGFQRPVAAFNVVAVRDTAAAGLSEVSGQGTHGGQSSILAEPPLGSGAPAGTRAEPGSASSQGTSWT